MKNFKAFTLAEVLITLGVIGVVAAITLPTLIKNYQKHVWVNQLKSSVSIWEQGMQKMLADEEVSKLSDTSVWASKGDARCYSGDTSYTTNTNCKNFVNNLSKYIKIVEVGKYGEKMKNLSGDGVNNESLNYGSLALSDGTMIFFEADITPYTNTTEECNEIKRLGGTMCSQAGSIDIDVNGRRGPNTWGRDVFAFHYSDEGKLYPYAGKDSSLHFDEDTWHDDYDICGIPDGKITSNTNGDGCAARIMENGWKMDY